MCTKMVGANLQCVNNHFEKFGVFGPRVRFIVTFYPS